MPYPWQRERPPSGVEVETDDDAFLVVDEWPREAFASHYHREFNWLVPLRGRLVVDVEGSERSLDSNHWICVLPWTEHRVVHVSEGGEVLSLFLPESAMERAYADLRPPPSVRERFMVGSAGAIAQGLAFAWGELRFSRRTRDETDQALERSVAGWIWRAYRPEADPSDDWALRLRMRLRDGGERAARFFDQHLADLPFPWDELARVLGLSRRTLQRRFMAEVGVPPAAALAGLRLERARELLKDPDRPISDIALACGFSSQSHLSTCFKGEFGLSPARFRKQALSSR